MNKKILNAPEKLRRELIKMLTRSLEVREIEAVLLKVNAIVDAEIEAEKLCNQ